MFSCFNVDTYSKIFNLEVFFLKSLKRNKMKKVFSALLTRKTFERKTFFYRTSYIIYTKKIVEFY